MGAGLLVGTALSVIIPEGMQTLVMAYSKVRPLKYFLAKGLHLVRKLIRSLVSCSFAIFNFRKNLDFIFSVKIQYR
jgi:hypothetical protein